MKIKTDSALFKYYDNTLTDHISFLSDGKEVTNICSLATRLVVCTVVYIVVFSWAFLFPSTLAYATDVFWNNIMFGNSTMFYDATLMGTFDLYNAWTIPFVFIDAFGFLVGLAANMLGMMFVIISCVSLPYIYLSDYIKNKRGEDSDREPNVFDVFAQRFRDFKDKNCTIIEYED